MTITGLAIRVEHGTGHTLEQAAENMVGLANRIGVMIICNVNRIGDMWAMPDEDPRKVLARWRSDFADKLR